MPPTEAGKAIKRWRTMRLWSIRRLARESNVSASYISQLESGDRPVTKSVTAHLADALGIPTYLALMECGFIPKHHLDEALDMARRAMDDPEMQKQGARGESTQQKIEWLTADYLMALGDDPYGTLPDNLRPAPSLDWRPLNPNAAPTIATMMRAELDVMLAQKAAPTPTQIEGWDELSEADRTFVQQMVNKLRRRPTGE